MDIIFSPRCLEYQFPGHPESPTRVQEAQRYLARRGFTFHEPTPATEEQLLAVHSPGLIRRVQEGRYTDPDCPPYPGIDLYARLSVGGAILAQKREGFSLMRPPGHHAGPDFFGGFCYYNSLAIAVKLSGRKTLIVDIDGHHGNGTEAVFFGDSQVAYVSLHTMYNYPGTGLQSRDNCFNFPLPFRCGQEVYLETLERALGMVKGKFEQLAISAGFDTHKKDPLASMGLEVESYYHIGRLLGALSLPTFCVLEGGYVPEVIGPAVEALITGLEESRAEAG